MTTGIKGNVEVAWKENRYQVNHFLFHSSLYTLSAKFFFILCSPSSSLVIPLVSVDHHGTIKETDKINPLFPSGLLSFLTWNKENSDLWEPHLAPPPNGRLFLLLYTCSKWVHGFHIKHLSFCFSFSVATYFPLKQFSCSVAPRPATGISPRNLVEVLSSQAPMQTHRVTHSGQPSG